MEDSLNSTVEQTAENTAPEAQQPIATLLSAISYTNQEDYDSFLANLTPEHAVIVLISAANHCQALGTFNLNEAELVAKAIKTLSKPKVANETPNKD